MTSMWYSLHLPGLFCGLVAGNPDIVSETLDMLKIFWVCLKDLEEALVLDQWFVGFHTNLVWPHMTWVREVLTGLAEYSFNAIPPWIQASVKAYAGRFVQTKVCEDAFQLLRHKAKFSGKHDVARRQR
eukprot:6473485-Amphidinium_carterae.1